MERAPAVQLPLPVRQCGERRNDQKGVGDSVELPQALQHRHRLRCLAKSHFVTKDHRTPLHKIDP